MTEREVCIMSGRPGRPPATATRDDILASARKTIAKHGFHALRIRQVAEQAGVNHATLLHHFPSKAALIAAVLEMTEAELAPKVDELPPSDPVQALREEFTDAVDRLTDGSEDFLVMLELLLAGRQRADIAARTARQFANWRAQVANIIGRGQDSGAFRRTLSPEEGASLITTYLTGLALTTVSGATDRGPANLADTAWKCLLSWLLPPDRLE